MREAPKYPEGSSTRFRFILVLMLGFHAAALHAWATVIVPVSDEALAEQAVAIVVGRVMGIESQWDDQKRHIFTHVTLRIEECLKGSLPIGEFTIKQPGGSIGELHSRLHGTAEFALGERALLFLRRNPDGSLRVAQLYQGKYTVERDAQSGEEVATRTPPRDVHVMNSSLTMGFSPPQEHTRHSFKEFKGRMQELVRQHRTNRQHQDAAAIVSARRADSNAAEAQAAYRYMGPARWFEPDTGTPVTMYINSGGEPLAPTSGLDQIRAGYSAWSDPSLSPFRYHDGGTTSADGTQLDGVNAVSFHDPLGQMDPPVGCTGTLAFTTIWWNGQTKTIQGTVFSRITEADVVFNDGWQGCGFYETFANFAEVATHELGHGLGLGHSPDPDATMYYLAHFDGRGAALRAGDIAGLQSIYPSSGTRPNAPTLLRQTSH